MVETPAGSVLIDFGLGPRTLARRMAARGLSWRGVRSVLLTHTHSDHWHEKTLIYLGAHGIRLCCHESHTDKLAEAGDGFDSLHAAGLVHRYKAGEQFDAAPGMTALPVPVPHDGETFGFRLEGDSGLFGPGWSLGYAADLGCWNNELAASLSDVDLLALEFNHDEEMQRNSGRPHFLIRRVLGDRGHLSNCQAGSLLGKVLRESTRTPPRYVVPLHLSRECNLPELAMAAARQAIVEEDRPANVVLSTQHEPSPTLKIGGNGRSRGRSAVA
jgi:phosphoribosyl 1,2-cyclic phosphodiesterase